MHLDVANHVVVSVSGLSTFWENFVCLGEISRNIKHWEDTNHQNVWGDLRFFPVLPHYHMTQVFLHTFGKSTIFLTTGENHEIGRLIWIFSSSIP